MKQKTKNLLIFGTGDLAEIANEYFTNDSEYAVNGFVVDGEYILSKEFCGLPLIPFENIETFYPRHPEQCHVYVACVYGNLNRDRSAICKRVKDKGYKLASYVSSRAFVSPSAKIGEHCFVFEGNVIQTDVVIGDNVILWSSNHVGHSTKIASDNFISSHVVISGHCRIGANCFLGVNSTLANNTVIGKESWISHGAVLGGNIPANSFVKPPQSDWVELNEKALARALERARR